MAARKQASQYRANAAAKRADVRQKTEKRQGGKSRLTAAKAGTDRTILRGSNLTTKKGVANAKRRATTMATKNRLESGLRKTITKKSR